MTLEPSADQMMVSPPPMNVAEDLMDLREMVQGTYEDLQLGLQTTTHHPSDGDDDNKSQIQTLVAAFQLAMGASLNRINEIVHDPSKFLDDNNHGGDDDDDDNTTTRVMEALAQLTWYLLRVAPFLGNPNQNLLVIRSSGALVECLDLDDRLVTKEHCGFLFHNVSNYVRLREQCLQNESPTDAVDAILQECCPPLMVYFAKRLLVLKELREDSPDIVEALQVWRRPIAMIRRFMLQAVEETILLVWVEKKKKDDDDDDDEKPTIRYAQRVKFTGLYVNKDMVEWATSQVAGLDPKLADAGKWIELCSWTGLIDTKEGILCSGEAQAIKSHRIYQEGIPDDIPTLDGERIVLCYHGMIERTMTGKVFPRIELEASLQGECLTETELMDLEMRIHNASHDEVRDALSHQMRRGSNDEMISQTIRRICMDSLLTEDALN